MSSGRGGGSRAGGRTKRRRPRPRIIHGLPIRSSGGGSGACRAMSGGAHRLPVHQMLGPRVPAGSRRRFSTPDTEGWQKVLAREPSDGCAGEGPAPARTGQGAPRCIPEVLRDKCFNCFSTSHRVVTCKLPPRCLRCRCFRHLARDCKRLRQRHPGNSAVTANGGNQPRHSGATNSGSQHAISGIAVGGVMGATLPVSHDL